MIESIPRKERVALGADFNRHVGEVNRGDEEVMGRFGVKDINLEGQAVVYFAKTMEMARWQSDLQEWRQVHRDRLYSM